jgi:hypothetical protein
MGNSGSSIRYVGGDNVSEVYYYPAGMNDVLDAVTMCCIHHFVPRYVDPDCIDIAA